MSKSNEEFELLLSKFLGESKETTEQEITLEELKEKYTEFVVEAGKAELTLGLREMQDSPLHINLLCKNKDKNAREYFMNKLRNAPEIEAMLILKLAITNLDLRDIIEERAAMRQFDAGLSGSVFLAVLSYIAPQRLKEDTIEELRPNMSFEDELKLLGIMR